MLTLQYTVFAASFALAIYAIAATVLPRVGRIGDALAGQAMGERL